MGERRWPLPLLPLLSTKMGTHALLEVAGAPFQTLNSTSLLYKHMQRAMNRGNLKPIQAPILHQFPTQGASAIIMLQESHFSVHTWPEFNYASVDIFTCDLTHTLPCPGRIALFEATQGWRCDDGATAVGEGGLFDALSDFVQGVGGTSAVLRGVDRGLPRLASGAEPSSGGEGGLVSWLLGVFGGSRWAGGDDVGEVGEGGGGGGGGTRYGGFGLLGGLEAGPDFRVEL